MWLTYTWVLVVALAAADDHWLPHENKWTTDRRTGKQYIRYSVPGHLTRARFQEACKSIGGFLPEPNDKEENEFLAQMGQGLLILPWLGMTNENGEWKWERGDSKVKWFNWHPQVVNQQTQNCVWMKDDKTWSDLMCDYAGIKSFICEKGTTAKPGNCNKCSSNTTFAPVCASNGFTYSHRCKIETWNCLNNQQITVFFEGECPPQNDCNRCPKNKPLAPVCGSNGYSYYHICVLKAWNCLNDQDIIVHHEGECLPDKPVAKPELTTKSVGVEKNQGHTNPACKDHHRLCPYWKHYCTTKYPTRMKKCPFTCGTCSGRPTKKPAVVEYPLTININRTIKNEDVLNTSTDAFKKHANETSAKFLKLYQSLHPAVVKVEVTGIRRGSTIMDAVVGVQSENVAFSDGVMASVVTQSAGRQIEIDGEFYDHVVTHKGVTGPTTKPANPGPTTNPAKLAKQVKPPEGNVFLIISVVVAVFVVTALVVVPVVIYRRRHSNTNPFAIAISARPPQLEQMENSNPPPY